MKRAGTFLAGLLIGGIVIAILMYFVFLKPNYEYVELKSDYVIENGGIIKQGTVLQVDKPFSEGFTRYILYLNLSDGEIIENHQEERNDVVIPYWLQSDTTKIE
jgi:hypothetical protein